MRVSASSRLRRLVRGPARDPQWARPLLLALLAATGLADSRDGESFAASAGSGDLRDSTDAADILAGTPVERPRVPGLRAPGLAAAGLRALGLAPLGLAAGLAGPLAYSVQTAAARQTGAIPSAGPAVTGAFGASSITSWVAAHFTTQTVGGSTIYDLTRPTS